MEREPLAAEEVARPAADGRARVVISGFSPEVEGGRFAAKRIAGEPVDVEADVFADGHDELAAVLAYRAPGAAGWTELPMEPLGNDRFRARFVPETPGLHEVRVVAWVDRFATWRRDLAARVKAGQDVAVELRVGAALLRELARRAEPADGRWLRDEGALLESSAEGAERALRPELLELAQAHDPRAHASRLEPARLIDVDRPRARDGAWYELFPRSCAQEPGRHGTLEDVEALLPRLALMGFDVLYLPPVHPIGRSNRKGRNNATVAGPGEPGSPWAIGSEEGGHEAIHPQLGTLAGFRRLVSAARDVGMEVAMDYALQCSPDHPWVEEHPEWFRKRPDGSIRHAENPPKKYEDIVPLDFECEDWRALWEAAYGVVDHWMRQGVRIFRVDNPHGKPFAFWEWLIRRARAQHPETFFLAEAFTRPKVMQRLAKLGFAQSYTYFTWRNTKAEIESYATEMTTPPVSDFMRPAFWPNTPDILHETLQHGGRGAFALRLVLAATLSGTYGVYGPAYEACEAIPLRPGSEEYRDSEKYEIRQRALDAPDSLAPLMARLNRIRRRHAAFRGSARLRFHPATSDAITCYSRTLPGDSPVLVVVNLDPHAPRWANVDLDLDELGIGPDEPFRVHDLLDGATYDWRGPRNYVRLDPARAPAHVFRVDRTAPAEDHPAP